MRGGERGQESQPCYVGGCDPVVATPNVHLGGQHPSLVLFGGREGGDAVALDTAERVSTAQARRLLVQPGNVVVLIASSQQEHQIVGRLSGPRLRDGAWRSVRSRRHRVVMLRHQREETSGD